MQKVELLPNLAARLDIEPDLFGGVWLMKEWGRIGARERFVAERFNSAELAVAALRRQADRKFRRPARLISRGLAIGSVAFQLLPVPFCN